MFHSHILIQKMPVSCLVAAGFVAVIQKMPVSCLVAAGFVAVIQKKDAS
jgi:hypothetical protein